MKGNYLRPSITAAGLDPDALGASAGGPGSLEFLNSGEPKAWRDIWGAGHGIGAVDEIRPAAVVVDRAPAAAPARGDPHSPPRNAAKSFGELATGPGWTRPDRHTWEGVSELRCPHNRRAFGRYAPIRC
ncbi:hypothetical protein [Nocardia sp. X0981]